MTPNTGQEVTMPDEGGWRTIDSAPKDGTPFLALNHDREVWIAKLDGDRLMFRMHRMSETRRWFKKSDDDGDWLRDDLNWKHRKDEWRNDWCLWTRGYDFKPTLWLPLPPPPKDSHNERSEG